jgi:hypothetical protein
MSRQVATMEAHATMSDDLTLIPIDHVREHWPSWPFSSWTTSRLIRAGELGAVCVGRRRFLTKPIVMEFLRRHTVLPSPSAHVANANASSSAA